MTPSRLAFAVSALTMIGASAAPRDAAAQPRPRAPSGPSAGSCKTYGTGRCCDPAIAAHLSKDAIFSACGKSEATFLGEQGSKDTCKYFFKVEGEKESEMYVQVYAPPVKGAAPSAPPDPFVTWKKAVGKVMIAEPKSMKGVKSDKVKAMAGDSSSAIGLYLPGNGYWVSVSAPAKVCSKADARRLAGSLK